MRRRELIEFVCFAFFAAVLSVAGGCGHNYFSRIEAEEEAGGAEQAMEQSSDATVGSVDVMSFNVRYGTADDGDNSWRYRKELVLDIIRRSEAEVVGLQEALRFQLDWIRERLPYYEEVGVGRDDGEDGGEFNAILVDTRRFELAEDDTFWLSDTPEVAGSNTWAAGCTRICTWAKLVDRRTDEVLWVFNTHFDHVSARARERSSRLIAERIEEYAGGEDFVLMGDFNAGEDSVEMRYLRGVSEIDGQAVPVGMVDSFAQVRPEVRERGTFNGFDGNADGKRIDYIFVSKDVEIFDAAILRYNEGGRYPSDHYPVTAIIAF
ncbi:exodeoxyribonuclease III (xth) [Anaerohalosphaera lusitana]|uniref:Exodeoxyribonuclease III (Xth) n=1 Tax=Anaerohalosphaera lusitana TaxID=1936003 RepID=A0A1U9NLA3_9BACT|nr:endonuclease/exonuclease/phosphatase family protein [Anaerohalosphaera lusitana]AQT68514.1 exodeoxyribonuclease III (xth) [Anaerohalosphaera lusitana]